MSPMTWSATSIGRRASSSRRQSRLMGSSCGLEPDVEAGGHAAEDAEGGLELALALGGDEVASRRLAAALGRGFAKLGADEPFGLEAAQRFVDGAEGEVASGASLDLVVDGDAVGAVTDAEDGEEDDLFELTEHCSAHEELDSVGNMSVGTRSARD